MIINSKEVITSYNQGLNVLQNAGCQLIDPADIEGIDVFFDMSFPPTRIRE